MKWILSVAIGIAISAMTIHAHHSIAGVYDTNRQMTIEATITEFQFINPHPFVLVEVKNDAGTQPWRLEMDNRRELIQIGMNGETLKPVIASRLPAAPAGTRPRRSTSAGLIGQLTAYATSRSAGVQGFVNRADYRRGL